jgi:hypothetical protein
MALLSVSGIIQWSPLNCWHDEIDINTGRYRHTQFLCYYKVNERTEDTWLSLAHESHNSAPDWRRVNTFSPCVRYSPHYRFHGTLSQVKTLEVLEHIIPFEPTARRKIAETVVESWQNSGSDEDSDRYVQEIAEIALALHSRGASIVKANDIPGEQ